MKKKGKNLIRPSRLSFCGGELINFGGLFVQALLRLKLWLQGERVINLFITLRRKLRKLRLIISELVGDPGYNSIAFKII